MAKAMLSRLDGRFYAHRGLHDEKNGVPENSREAFRLAAMAGYGAELDVRLSKDGVLMVFHDSTLERMCGCSGSVEEQTAAQLKILSLAGTAHTLPTLADCLQALNGAPLIVEIKDSPRLKEVTLATAKALAAYPGPWCVESFHPSVLRILKKHAPHAVRGQLALSRRRPGHWLVDTAQKYLLHLPYSQPDFVAYEVGNERRNPALWAVKHGWRLPLAAWTIRTPAESEAARQAGYTMQIFEGWRP